MGNGFEVQVSDRLDPVDAGTWNRLFPGLADSLEMIRLVQASGMEGFDFKSLLVRHNNRPILLLPLFHLRLEVRTLVDGSLRRWVGVGAKVMPRLLRPGVLGVGFVEGEWGAVGVEPEAHVTELREAWSVAMEELWRLARRLGATVGLFLNFTSESARWVPPETLAGFVRLATYPTGQLRLPFATEEQYLETLSKNMRKDLRRKQREAGDIRVERTTDPRPYLDAIYDLYCRLVARSEMSFGMHRRTYFERVCADVPGAGYTLYFLKGRLLAFNLLVEHGEMLVDKYFGMDETLGRERNLYFVSWMENVRYCIARKIPLYHAGPGAEATKVRLGAELMASLTMVRHRNPLIQPLLKRAKGMLAYTPEIEIPAAMLGTGYQG